MNLSTLLPKIRLLACSEKLDSIKAINDLNHDWRFARVDIEVCEGGFDLFVDRLKQVPDTNVILIEVDKIDDEFQNKLESLAAYCDEDMLAIVAGRDNDVQLYRHLIDMGVSDYIVTPFTQQTLSDVLMKAVIEKMGLGQSRLIGVVGAKGGVGASTIAQSLAWGLSEIAHETTALLDAAGGHSVLSVDVGFDPATSLLEASSAAAAKDDDALSRMIYKASDNLDILASGSESVLSQDSFCDDFESLLDWMLLRYPYVVVDLSSAPNELVKTALTRASDVLCVSTPFLSSLRFMRSLVEEVKALRGNGDKGLHLALNQLGFAKDQEVSLRDIEKALGRTVHASMPFAPQLFMACEGSDKQVIECKGGRDLIADNLLPLIIEVKDCVQKDNGFIAGLMHKVGLGK